MLGRAGPRSHYFSLSEIELSILRNRARVSLGLLVRPLTNPPIKLYIYPITLYI